MQAATETHQNVLLCIPRLSGGGSIMVASSDGDTIIAQHSVKKILFCAKGEGGESTFVGFTTHLLEPNADGEKVDVFRCQIFRFADAASTEHSLQCIAQAFGNTAQSTSLVTCFFAFGNTAQSTSLVTCFCIW
jgi:hypothetical protein